MQRTILIVLLVLAMLVDGFFALINFYPVAPKRSRGPQRFIVAELDASQARWLQDNLIAEFNDEYDANLTLRVTATEDIPDALRAAHAHGNDIVLAALPGGATADVLRAGLVAPFDGVISGSRINSDFSDLRPRTLQTARAQGRQFFLPRSLVLDVAVYRVSRVRDVMLHWSLLRGEIDAALRAANGHGLPANYDLEQDPTEWDSYDQFVLAYYWARRSYDGQPARPRIAHRTGDDLDAQLDVAAGIYRAGADDATFAHTDSRPVQDYFQWETLYRAHNLYAPEMFADDGADDEAILEALQRGDLFLTTIDQVEAFTLHGGAHRGARAQIANPDDLGFVAIPRFSSLELNAQGRPARTASSFSFREESVWALPAGTPDARLAYRFVRWMWDRENHWRECEALGVMPVRTDVSRERTTLFRSGWMTDIFEAGFAQLPRAQSVPASFADAGLGATYAQLWNRIVAPPLTAPTAPDALLALLRAPPTAPPPTPSAAAHAAPEPHETHAGSERNQRAAERGARSGAFNPLSLRDQVVLEGLGSRVDAGRSPEEAQ